VNYRRARPVATARAHGRSGSAEGFGRRAEGSTWTAESSFAALSGASAGGGQRLGIAQRFDLAWFQQAPLAGFHIQSQCAVADALDLLHVMPDLLKHAADLPVAAFRQRHLVPGVVLVAHQIDFGRQSVLGLRASRHAGTSASHGSCARSLRWQVNAAAQLVDLFLGGRAAHFYLIGLGNVGGRLSELLHEFAVVGEQQQPFARVVEPSDGEHSCLNAL